MVGHKKIQWEPSSFKGIRFYKHKTRRHGVKYDRYFSGQYQVAKKRRTIGFGWESEGWSEKDCWEKLNQYRINAKTGSGPTTLNEEADLVQNQRDEIAQQQDPDNPDNITFERFYRKKYLTSIASKTNADTTQDREKFYFKLHLVPHLGHKPLNQITSEDLEQLLSKLIDIGLAPRTIEQCFALFNKVWTRAQKKNFVQTISPAKAVTLPRVENQNNRFFSPEEARLLLDRLKITSPAAHDLTLLSIHTGMRRGELFDLTWGAVDLDNGIIDIRDAKGKRRHAFLTDETAALLKSLYDDQLASDRVFLNDRGVRYTGVPRAYFAALKKLGFNDGVDDRRDKATFHTCRHTFGSWHVQNGTDLYTLKELMGHSTIKVTERYAHLRPDGLKAVAQRFNELVKRH